jgi:hypothetical protein
MTKPDFGAQFRSETTMSREYVGGYSRSCGEHPSLPKQHRWGKVRSYKTSHGVYRDRMCLVCALTKGVDEKGRDL